MAAARKVSAATSNGVNPCLRSRPASFAMLVVFPTPFTPTAKITKGLGPVRMSSSMGFDSTDAKMSAIARCNS